MRFHQALLPLGFTVATVACTPQARVTGVTDGIKVALCVAENQDLPDVEVIAKCIGENVTPEDVTRILSQQRAATKRAALRSTCAPAPAPASNSIAPASSK